MRMEVGLTYDSVQLGSPFGRHLGSVEVSRGC
jgi:hypothetical protein